MKYEDIIMRDAPVAKQNGNHPSYWWSGVGALIGLGASMAAYAYWHEPFNVALEELTFHLPGAKGRLPEEGLRILHLSDTHFQGRNHRENIKIECIRRLTD